MFVSKFAATQLNRRSTYNQFGRRSRIHFHYLTTIVKIHSSSAKPPKQLRIQRLHIQILEGSQFTSYCTRAVANFEYKEGIGRSC